MYFVIMSPGWWPMDDKNNKSSLAMAEIMPPEKESGSLNEYHEFEYQNEYDDCCDTDYSYIAYVAK